MPEEFVSITQMLTVDDVAVQLTRNASYVRRLCHQQKIGHYKFGKFLRFNQAQVDSFLAKHKVEVFVQPEKKPLSATDLKMGRF